MPEIKSLLLWIAFLLVISIAVEVPLANSDNTFQIADKKDTTHIEPTPSPLPPTPRIAPDHFLPPKSPEGKSRSLGLISFFNNILSPGRRNIVGVLRLRKARQHYVRAQMFLQRNTYGKALREFEAASRLDKKAKKPRLQIARCLLYLNQYKKVIKVCRNILKEESQYTPALLLIAKTQELTDHYQDAEKTYRRILSYQPDNIQALQALGTIYYQHSGNIQKTIEVYSHILKLNRKDIMALVILGSAYALQGNVDKSLEYYSTAIHYRPALIASYLNLARLLEESRNFEGARKVYHQALLTAPENNEILAGFQKFIRIQAVRKLQKRKLNELRKAGKELTSLSLKDLFTHKDVHSALKSELLEEYRQLAEDQSTSSPALIKLYANTLLRYDKLDAARKQFHRILRINPDNYRACVALGNIALLRGKHKEALKEFDRAIAINPDNTEVYSQIGAVYLDRKEYKKALDLYKKAIQIKPDEEKLYLILYGIYEKLNMEDKIEETLKHVLKNHPKRPTVYALLGDFYRQREHYSDALEAFRKAYQLRKSSTSYATMVVTLLLGLGKNNEAITFAESAAKGIKPRKEYFLLTGITFSDFALFDESINFLEHARDQDPTDIKTYGFLASVYDKKKEYEKAIGILEAFRQKFPDKANTTHYFQILASIYAEQRNTKKALETYRRAASLTPKDDSIYLAWASLLNREKCTSEALSILDDAFKHIDRNSEKGMFLEAQILAGQKKYKRAERLFKLLLEKNPDEINYVYNLGLMCYDAGRLDEAEILLRKVIEKDPDNADARNNLGYMFAEHSVKLNEAEKLVKKALLLRPGAAYMIDSLGWVYYQKGEYEKALKCLTRAEDLSLEDPVLFDHLGDVYLKLGDLRKAREYWQRAHKLDPDLKGLKEKLNK